MDLVALFTAFVYVCIAFGIVLVVCELCQRACDHFNDIDLMVMQWNWYLLPDDIQRLLPLILIVMQQPVELECFGRISCNRETSSRVNMKSYIYLNLINGNNYFQVVSKGFSVFTVLRQFMD